MILKTATRRKLDAIDHLRADHMLVELLFLQTRAAREPKRREELFGRIREALEEHARIEENVFYPACERYPDLRPMILESYEEHREIKSLLSELSELTARSEHFNAKLKVLFDDVSHHVNEEENYVFPRARKHLSRTRLERMVSEFKPKRRRRPAKAA